MELPKSHNTCFVAHPYMYSFLNSRAEMLLKTNSNVIISLLDTRTLHHTLCFGLLTSKSGPTGAGAVGDSVLPSPSCHHFQHKCWSTQGCDNSRRRYDRFLGYLCFFKRHCLLSACRVSSALNGKRSLSAPERPALSITDLTPFPRTRSGSLCTL